MSAESKRLGNGEGRPHFEDVRPHFEDAVAEPPCSRTFPTSLPAFQINPTKYGCLFAELGERPVGRMRPVRREGGPRLPPHSRRTVASDLPDVARAELLSSRRLERYAVARETLRNRNALVPSGGAAQTLAVPQRPM